MLQVHANNDWFVRTVFWGRKPTSGWLVPRHVHGRPGAMCDLVCMVSVVNRWASYLVTTVLGCMPEVWAAGRNLSWHSEPVLHLLGAG